MVLLTEDEADEQVRMKVLSLASLITISSDPFLVLAPSQSPEAMHESVFEEDQVKVISLCIYISFRSDDRFMEILSGIWLEGPLPPPQEINKIVKKNK